MLRISCEAVPPSNSPAGAQGGTSARSTGAALGFVSCIRLFGRSRAPRLMRPSSIAIAPRPEGNVWTVPGRHRLMKLRLGDNVTLRRGVQTVEGTMTRVESDGFWIIAPDGMSYRFSLADSTDIAEPSR
jgi:hypothetical protein